MSQSGGGGGGVGGGGCKHFCSVTLNNFHKAPPPLSPSPSAGPVVVSGDILRTA